ncbi:MAG: alpha/beta hydrolase [Acidimicrobiales bacterium]|nr:alpha/beta hydrolase [Acidimicrobiales bacterium]
MSPAPTVPAETRFLARPEGRIAYEVHGDGPLVVCLPGMGDVRSVYRFVVPALVAGGYRVALADLRGHGDSDAGFTRHDGVAAGTDLLALVDHLGGGPAALVGGSLGAGAAVWAAAEAPGQVAGLVLIGPFVRDVPLGLASRLALRLGLCRPWGPAAWSAFYARLYTGRPPADLAEHRERIRASLRRPGHWRSFVATARSSHAAIEARLDGVSAPTLVIMGERDPDFPDPAAEARLVGGRLRGEVLLVPDAGHYPQAEWPEVVAPAVLGLLERAEHRA